MPDSRTIRLLLPAAAALLVAAAFLVGYYFLAPAPEAEHATVLPEPRELPAFELRDQHGEAWTGSDLEDQWHVLFFGFTHCPDVCPITLGVLANAVTRMDNAGHKSPRVVFVTVDPERDDEQRVGEYAGYFHDAFIGVTGEREQTDSFARAAAIGVQRHPADDAGDYLIDHTASLVVVDPQGRIAAYFTPPLEPAAIAADMRIIMGQRR